MNCGATLHTGLKNGEGLSRLRRSANKRIHLVNRSLTVASRLLASKVLTSSNKSFCAARLFQTYLAGGGMRNASLILKVIAWCSALLVLALPSRGSSIPVHSASGYGQQQSFTDCLNGTYSDADNNCEGFSGPTPIDTVIINGTSYPIYQIVGGDNGSGNNVTVLDLINLGGVTSGTTFSLPSSFFDPTTTYILGCDNDGGGDGVYASGSTTPLTTICTPDSSPMVTLNTNGSFTAENTITDLVLFSQEPVATTPEPSSLSLLALGLIPIAFIGRRRLFV